MNEVDQIKQEIADKTVSLGAKVEALQETARTLVDPIAQIEEHPLAAMAICFGAGLFLASQSKQSRKLLEPLAMGVASTLVTQLTKSLERGNS